MKTMSASFRPFASWLTFAVSIGVACSAQPSPAQVDRASKIATSLSIGDEAKQARVGTIVAGFYADLDELQAAGKTDEPASKGADERVANLRQDFFEKLAGELTPDQIEKVKNGLTYNVLPITFGVYQEMLPDLTSEQKQQILAWLTEARDLAITAGSSDKKHECFRKYKGRINNYLSKLGIDMKKAGDDLAERKKQPAAGK
jgi:hypothetical protein